MSIKKVKLFITSNDGDKGRNKDAGNDNNHKNHGSSTDRGSKRKSNMDSNKDKNRIVGNHMVQDRVASRRAVQLQHIDLPYS